MKQLSIIQQGKSPEENAISGAWEQHYSASRAVLYDTRREVLVILRLVISLLSPKPRPIKISLLELMKT